MSRFVNRLPALQLQQLEERLPTNALYSPGADAVGVGIPGFMAAAKPPMTILYDHADDAGTRLAEVDFSSDDSAADVSTDADDWAVTATATTTTDDAGPSADRPPTAAERDEAIAGLFDPFGDLDFDSPTPHSGGGAVPRLGAAAAESRSISPVGGASAGVAAIAPAANPALASAIDTHMDQALTAAMSRLNAQPAPAAAPAASDASGMKGFNSSANGYFSVSQEGPSAGLPPTWVSSSDQPLPGNGATPELPLQMGVSDRAATEAPPDLSGAVQKGGPDKQAMVDALAKEGLWFETNVGQFDSGFDFAARGGAYNVGVNASGAALELGPPSAGADPVVIGMQLIGGNPAAKGEGRQVMPGLTNYLSSDPAQQHTGVVSYAQAACTGVYKGVDLVYHTSANGQLEYDFIVAPGADARQITLGFKGTDALSINAKGELVLHTTSGDVVQHPPTAYDIHDEVLSVSTGTVQAAQYRYDSLGRRTWSYDSNGQMMGLRYDAAGNLTWTQDGLYNVTTYQYDLFNRRTAAIDALGDMTTFAYDAMGNVTSITDRDGRRRALSYDALNRATQEIWYNADGTVADTITSTRDLADELLTIHNAAGTVTTSYDALGRVSTTTDVFGVTLTLSYDAADRRTQASDSFGGLATYLYDLAGRLTGETAAQPGTPGAVLTYAYNAASQLTGLTAVRPDLVASYGYDASGRLSVLAEWNALRNVELITYSYDAAITGFVNKEDRTAWRTPSDNSPTQDAGNALDPHFTYSATFAYDPVGQMTNAGGVPFNYDGDGNQTINGVTYGRGNRLLGDTLWTYTYDAEGNLTQKTSKTSSQVWLYHYDTLNHLTGAAEWEGSGQTAQLLVQATYAYDALGRRVREQDWQYNNGAPLSSDQRFVYDGATPLFDLNASGALTAEYVHAPTGALAAQLQPGRSLWYVTDHQGSVIDILDDSGAALERVKYAGYTSTELFQSPAGTTSGYVQNLTGTMVYVSWSGAGVSDRFRVTGKEFDAATGLVYMDGNNYDPSLGRFVNEALNGLAGTNLYRYARNNPVNVDLPASWDWLNDWANNPFGQAGRAAADNWRYLVSPVWGAATDPRVRSAAAGYQDGRGDGSSERWRQSSGWDDGVDYQSEAYLGGRGYARSQADWMGRLEREWGRDPKQAGVDFGAGLLNTMTAGLSGRLSQWAGLTDYGEHSASYQSGHYVGFAANIAIAIAVSAAQPQGVVLAGLEVYNGIQMLGGGISAYEAYQKGDYWAAADLAAIALSAGLRGVSPCGWAAEGAELAHRGLLVYNIGRASFRAADAAAHGDGLEALLNVADAAVNAYNFSRACFAGDTELETEAGLKRIDQIHEGERVWARPEGDPDGPVELRVVEEVFVRTAALWRVVVGGKTIRTTGEHPFYVRDRGWTAAKEVKAGDVLRTRDGWADVEAVEDTGEWTRVYNLRVAEYHTYFVGGEEWGFAIWAHNAEYGDLQGKEAAAIPEIQRRLQEWHQGQGDCTTHSLGLAAEFQQDGVPAAMRSPTGPGQHDMVSLFPRPLIVDVTASQFLHLAPDPNAVHQQFYRELYVTGVWTHAEYNSFLQSIDPNWHF